MTFLNTLQQFLLRHSLDGYLLSHRDRFGHTTSQEALGPLHCLTSFTGSAGLLLITPLRLFLFVDGRYIVQAGYQVDKSFVAVKEWTQDALEQTLKDVSGKVCGYDPWRHTINEHQNYEKLFNKNEWSFTAVDASHLGALSSPFVQGVQQKIFQPHPLSFSGKSVQEKITALEGCHPHVGVWGGFSGENIAWLLNMRGYHHVPFVPIPSAYGFLKKGEGFFLFMDEAVIHPALYALWDGWVSVFPVEKFIPMVCATKGPHPIRLDTHKNPVVLKKELEKTTSKQPEKKPANGSSSPLWIAGANPCGMMQCIKNDQEISGAKKAHLWDGIALINFLHWIKNTMPLDGSQTEFSASMKLASIRKTCPLYDGPSFESIAAYGKNSAMIHYHPPSQGSALLKKNNIFLIDSGGQYTCGGTTDVTRTVVLGKTTLNQKMFYTHVLKGHIALAKAIFPQGTKGCHLDVLARLALWGLGKDYAHGTGHGVGSYLNVHEGPVAISKGADCLLCPGMVLSNEPGYYEENAYGIRIENMMVVQRHSANGFLCFEPLTLAPFETDLIDASILNCEEKHWLNAYHEKTFQTLAPYLLQPQRQWLALQTKPVI